MAMTIAILEDNPDRRDVMRRLLEDRFYSFEARFFDRAAALIDFLEKGLNNTIVLCLDHDLELMPDHAGRLVDPGTGRDVVDYLVRREPVCPVVIHSTNSPAVLGMEGALREAGWQTFTVAPYGDTEWIQEQWFPTVRRAIVGPVSRSGKTAKIDGAVRRKPS